MNKKDFIESSIVYKDIENEINILFKKHVFLSRFLFNFFNILLIFSITIFLFLEKYMPIFYILLFYFLFITLKQILSSSYLRKSFNIIIENEKKYSFLKKSIQDFMDIFNEKELYFIKNEIHLIKDKKKFSWKQARNYMSILKNINSKEI